MLFVTGKGPTWNSVSADAATPCDSLAKALRALESDRKIRASFLTRDMGALDDGKGWKGIE
ncbi:MAG TPA: hypothetical protein PLU52_01350 [Opitutaceae bacterium]|nr:hypothetical protein [Opitutaceae bacterium]HND62255.1 hypothetical protein [Opitutaceae bacterium]